MSLAPSITEIIYYSGLQKYLVGNTVYCDYPAEAQKITHVGDLINPNIETLKKLHPDYVILVSPLQSRIKMKLMSAGFKTIECRQSSFNDIVDCMYKIGKIAGDTTGYVKFTETLKALDTLKKINKRVLFVLSKKPLYTAGKNTFIDEIIQKAGAKNAVEFSDYRMLSVERIVELNPDLVVIACPGVSISEFKKTLGIRNIKATKNNCVFKAPADIFTRPGPRVIKATLLLHNYLLKCCNKDGKDK